MAFTYTVTRNVESRDALHNPVKIALCTVSHENGHQETVAVREELIAFAGEEIIKVEVERAMTR